MNPLTATRIPKAVRHQLERRPGTVGQMEALAGLASDHASRFAFWVVCDRIARERHVAAWATGEQVMVVARERCYALTWRRLRAGEICLI
jgi:hypothetical protein